MTEKTEERILNYCLSGLKAYNEAQTLIDLGDAADKMADTLEAVLRAILEKDPEIANTVNEYFQDKKGFLEKYSVS